MHFIFPPYNQTILQYDSNAEDKKLNKPCLELKIIFQLVYLKPFTHSCHSFIFNTFIPHQKISIFVFAGVRKRMEYLCVVTYTTRLEHLVKPYK